MIYEEDGRYYKVCDECGKITEIQKQSFKKNGAVPFHLCSSCRQRGSRNHRFTKKPWNAGLTKNTDLRVLNYGEKCSVSKLGNIPWNKGASYVELKGHEWATSFKKRLSACKKGIPNLKLRGITTDYAKSFKNIRKLVKARLYSSWVSKVLCRDKYRCLLCGSIKDLEVHHTVPFKDIVKKSANTIGIVLQEWRSFTKDQIEALAEEVINSHHTWMGMTVCKACHAYLDDDRRRFISREECTNESMGNC